MGLDSDVQDILRLDTKITSVKSEAIYKLRELQKKIKNGESTGDKIKDFVIANIGIFHSDTEKPYREMEEKLRNGAGSQILIVKQRESIHGCPGIVPPAYINPLFIGVDTELNLGVLISGLELDVKRGHIIFPTEKYAKKLNGGMESKWMLENGTLFLDCYEFSFLGKKVHTRTMPMPNDSSANFEQGLTIYIGQGVEEYFSRIGRSVVSYVEALNLLGQEVPENLKKGYEEYIYEQKIGIINKLEGLVSMESRLTDEILSIFKSTKDKDDARIISLGLKMKLGGVMEEMKTYLIHAKSLGMHKENLRIEKGKGIEINVPVYISAMCEKHKIIP